jgi:signal transduction histidine kinase
MESHGIEVEVRLSDGKMSAMENSHQLEQVLLNLLRNAADAVDEKRADAPWHAMRGQIGVRSQLLGDRIHVTIQDNGSGMSAETQARIFEPFFTTKETDRGTGLGLAIAHSIVQNHDGILECESRPGDGTKVVVSLPLAPEGWSSDCAERGPARHFPDLKRVGDDDVEPR